jgi:BMFP domain-containing protein YqiC
LIYQYTLRYDPPMAPATKKFTPEIDAQLYDEFVGAAERNGQTKRHVLEEALRFYLHNVVPSQHLVRREVMDAFEESVTRNRELLQRLAK